MYIMNASLFKHTTFNQYKIRYNISDGQLWVCAKDLSQPLGVTDGAINKQIQSIPEQWKRTNSISTSTGAKNAIFINKKGALKIIMKVRTKQGSDIDMFQNWAVEKLDELLTTGKTELKPQPAIDDRTYELRMRESAMQEKRLELKKRELAIDERRIAIEEKQLAMQAYQNINEEDDAVICTATREFYVNTMRNDGQEAQRFVDVAELIRELGITANRSSVGRWLAKNYRAQYNREPMQAMKYVNGADRPCKVYPLEEKQSLMEMLIAKFGKK